ncbi:hypothetical protein L2331_28715 [Mesorhizobium muleiense]|nr:hypothetical protein [Mesorhizobium muleiense]
MEPSNRTGRRRNAQRTALYLVELVASSKDRIEEAKAEWRAEDWGKGRFDLPIDDRDEHIPYRTDRR